MVLTRWLIRIKERLKSQLNLQMIHIEEFSKQNKRELKLKNDYKH